MAKTSRCNKTLDSLENSFKINDMVKTLFLSTILLGSFSVKAVTTEELLTTVIVLEAGSETQKGIESVIEVVHNRAIFDNVSVYKTLTKKRAFSCLNKGITRAVNKARKHKKWPQAYKITQEYLKEGKPKTNHTGGATHFENVVAFGVPRWARYMKKTAIVGKHHFYK